MKSSDKVVVAWCDPGMVDGYFAADMMKLGGARRERIELTIRAEGGGLLSRTRNQVVATFLDRTESNWLWMVDTDHRVPVEVFDLLVAAAHEKSHPVVAGLYFGTWPHDRQDWPYPQPVPVAYTLADDGTTFNPITDIEPRGLHKVDGAGTGCLMVHRSVLQAMRDEVDGPLKQWCWFQDGPIGDGRWLSEDLTFCARLGRRGVPIHVHTGAVLPHHKQHWESDETWQAWRKDDGQQR